MKNVKKSVTAVSMNMLLIFMIIAGIMIASCSCGKTKPKEPAISELAPPPPPPPPMPKEDKVFTTVDEMPQFQGGDAALSKYILANTKYPEASKKNGITGRVVVKFVVEKDGSVTKVEVEKGVDPSLDAEAVRVVSSLPNFEKPGKNAGELVRVQYRLPISFALN